MADKKLKTFDVTLSFSFQTKFDDFMNPDFNFDNVSIIFDIARQKGLINLSSDLIKSKHFFITADIKDLVFNCCSKGKTIFSAKDFFNSFVASEGLDPIGNFVVCYQPIIGPDFFLGANKQKELLSDEEKKAFLSNISEKFSRRRRNKKA